jgi:conjugal transfer pilus assembly protein TraB
MKMPDFLQQKVDQWNDMPTGTKALLIGVAVLGCAFWWHKHGQNAEAAEVAKAAKIKAAAAADAKRAGGADAAPSSSDDNRQRVIPGTNRNMGLEDLSAEIGALRSEVERLRKERERDPAASSATFPAPGAAMPRPTGAGGVDLNAPAPVTFDAPGGITAGAPMPTPKGSNKAPASLELPSEAPAAQPNPKLKVWDRAPAAAAEAAKAAVPTMVIPANSGLDGVLLTGVAARPAGGQGGGAMGAVTSAMNIGVPFVTRIKGDALMPNYWRHARLSDCFISGEGLGSLSMERVNAIADKVSCIDEDGQVWEGSPKAYAVDADGTAGLAGRVVSRQGRLLAQAALAGMAAGLGQALSPQAVAGSNTSASGGTQAYQTPSAGFIAAGALSGGLAAANAQLAKFYLDYAKEIFPVVEVPAGTRVTWILRETLELRPGKEQKQ